MIKRPYGMWEGFRNRRILFLAPTYGSFVVYVFLIGMMISQHMRTAEP